VKTFAGVLTTVLIVGIALLLWGCFGGNPQEVELATAGAILIGSWLLSISILHSDST
jgi:hypothetical protein